MREFCSYGSVRGALSNERPYRERMNASFVVADGCRRLMLSSPPGPRKDEGFPCRWADQDPCQEIADLGNARDQGCHTDQAEIGVFGLVSFGLLHALRRRSADSLERKARAAMHRLMCRCHPCHERASQ